MTRDGVGTPGRVLVFIESNTSGTGRLFVRAARELGCRPVLITARPEKYDYLSGPDAPEVIAVARVEEEPLEALIRGRFDDGAGVTGITSSSEYFVQTAAALAARVGLPGPDPAAVRATRDKSQQRHVLASARLPTPRFVVINSVAEAMEAARQIGGPVVVKPVDGTGSIGVRACARPADAAAHAATLLARSDNQRDSRLLVEALIEGPEFSVELFAGCALGVTRKHLGARPYFVEIGHDYPADTALAATLRDTAERAAAMLGLSWGPLHCELRVQEDAAYVIEMNPRLAGGFIPELIRQAEGLDPIRQVLRLVMGLPPDLTRHHRRHAAIRFLVAPAAGTLVRVDGLTAARALTGVVDITLYRAIGSEIGAWGDFRDRVGHVIACADRMEDACNAAEAARGAIALRLASAVEGVA